MHGLRTAAYGAMVIDELQSSSPRNVSQSVVKTMPRARNGAEQQLSKKEITDLPMMAGVCPPF